MPIIELATRVMLGEKLKNLGYGIGVYAEPKLVSVKVPVFSTQKLPEVEVCLGPEMRSTGEVLGVGRNFEEALYKGFVAAGMKIKKEKGVILATINSQDKEEFAYIAKAFSELNYKFIATKGTAKLLNDIGIDAVEVNKIQDGTPNIIDVIKSRQVDLIINTATKGNDSKTDGFRIRRTAIESNVLVITSLDTAKAVVELMKKNIMSENLEVFNIVE